MIKTVKVSIINLTKSKKRLIDTDYNNYQWWMIFGIDHGLLSCFKASKKFKQKKIKYKEYSLPLWAVLIKDWFRERETKITKHWLKIPNSQRKGRGMWLPLKFHQPLPEKFTIKDSYLLRKNSKYYLYLCIEIPEPKPYKPKEIIGIDTGLKNPITSIELSTRKTKFIGKELNQIRGKYYYLRKKLGKNKKLKQIQKMKNKEKRKINTLLHKISKDIITEANKKKAAIVIGRLKGINKTKGRLLNRKLSNFSYYKLTQFLEYKTKEKGVPLIKISEWNTSKTCSACGSTGKRTKNWFTCKCGHKDNADRNAAFNIAKRGLSYMLRSGAQAYAQKPIIMNGQAHNSQKMQICNMHY